jgi:nicotinamide-nucleotide amidase
MIVVTGGELLEGAYADGHTHFLARTLRPLGLRCVGSMSVDDKQEDINAALQFATGKAALVIVTGGLGPTDNDITRETLAGFSEIALHEHPDVLREMQRRFKASPDQLRRNLRRQALVPMRGTYLKNPNGTAVGLVFERTDTVIVALPGPPRELQPMVRDELLPYLSQRFGTRLPGCALTLRFVGIGQSRIDQTLEDHVPLPADITVSSQFERGRVDFTFSMPDDTTELRTQLQELKQKILHHLGDYVYADGGLSLEEHIVRRLASRGETLTIAEAGSGGSFTAGFTTADSARSVLAGAYVAPTDDKVRKLLRVPDQDWLAATSSGGAAKRLAVAAADATSCEWAVAIGEAQEDNDGARFVEVVFKTPDGRVESQRHRLRGDESERSRLTTQILDDLRQRLK